MKCELCKEREATIHLTQVVDGVVKKVHFCEACAEQSGFDVQGPVSITDILLGLGGPIAPEAPTPAKSRDRSCPRCHLRRADFKKTGRLGCPACYEAFKDELTPLLKVMHRSEQHKGKIPERERDAVRHTVQLETLQQQLQEAVAVENFEEAARLRDCIQAIRSSSGTGERT